jgi:molybdate transport system substrate-binding protein
MIVALAAATLLQPLRARAQETKTLRIAAASDLQPVMPVLAQAYEKKTGVKLIVSTGSSGALTTQIINGAPFDIFLGADFMFPEKLIAADLATEKEPVPYAKGTLVLWSRRDLAVPLSMALLTDPRVTRIAIANEFHAPFGRAAYEALRSLKLSDEVKGKLVVGENVMQTAQFIESGNAQMGFISLTLASTDKLKAEGQYVLVPRIYPPIQQCAVVLKRSKDKAGAEQFLEWMRGSEVQENLTKFGLEPVR